MAEMVAAGRMTESERCYKPRKPGNLGAKKDDHGELPMEYPAIKTISDPIHFFKNYKSKLYILVALAKLKSQTSKADAMRSEKSSQVHLYAMKTNVR